MRLKAFFIVILFVVPILLFILFSRPTNISPSTTSEQVPAVASDTITAEVSLGVAPQKSKESSAVALELGSVRSISSPVPLSPALPDYTDAPHVPGEQISNYKDSRSSSFPNISEMTVSPEERHMLEADSIKSLRADLEKEQIISEIKRVKNRELMPSMPSMPSIPSTTRLSESAGLPAISMLPPPPKNITSTSFYVPPPIPRVYKYLMQIKNRSNELLFEVPLSTSDTVAASVATQLDSYMVYADLRRTSQIDIDHLKIVLYPKSESTENSKFEYESIAPGCGDTLVQAANSFIISLHRTDISLHRTDKIHCKK